MLPPKTLRTPGRPQFLLAALLAGVALVVAGRPACAADDIKTSTSLSMIPADAAFYSSSLRLKEQIDIFYKSNAYKVIRSLPIVKEGIAKAMAELEKEGAPLAMYKQFIEKKENKELVDLLLDSVSHEIFLYGGKGWNDFLALLTQLNYAQQFAPLQTVLGGKFEDVEKDRMRAMLRVLKKNRKLIKMPDFVIGFKLTDSKKAAAHLDRLHKMVADAAEALPFLKRVKRDKTHGDLVVLELDGSLIPWDEVPVGEIEEKKGEFDDLIKHIKSTKLTVSLGTRGSYLLLGITDAAKDLARIGGKGKSLADREEFKPLMKHADKPIVSIGYASKAFISSAEGEGSNFDSIVQSLTDMVNKADLKEERKKAMLKDLKELGEEARKHQRVHGAAMAFSFMTGTGYEHYDYVYAQGPAHKDHDCKLHHHVGGNPIAAFAFAGKVDGEGYKSMVKWMKKAYGHAEAIFLDKADDDAKKQYREATEAIFPLLKRLDEATANLLIPALKETGLAFVMDAKWSSKQWHRNLPESPKALPMLELAMVLGISDAKKFTSALKEYRTTLNELYEKIRDKIPEKDNIPEFKIPAAEQEKGKHGTLYFYPIPEEVGLDKQVQPVMGVSKHVAAFALSKEHAERLMANTPLKVKSGPLARKGKFVGMGLLDWPAFIDAISPWVEFAAMASIAIGGDDAEGGKKMVEGIVKQIHTGLNALKAYKGFTSVTYVEGDALVTHRESVFKDIPAPKVDK
jgi:hypothetical protein